MDGADFLTGLLDCLRVGRLQAQLFFLNDTHAALGLPGEVFRTFIPQFAGHDFQVVPFLQDIALKIRHEGKDGDQSRYVLAR